MVIPLVSGCDKFTRAPFYYTQKNDAMRQVLQQTREEWITGLTHDLKTPLSSIYGYALLLESQQYNWTDRDIQQFGSVMKEKSQYMTTLIDDLSLTYQLKNNSLPAQHVNIEMNQFVQKYYYNSLIIRHFKIKILNSYRAQIKFNISLKKNGSSVLSKTYS